MKIKIILLQCKYENNYSNGNVLLDICTKNIAI